MRRTFTTARYNAKRRGIPWSLSFEDWVQVWMQSGKYEQRGRRTGQFQMDREDNKQGYKAGNVRIVDGTTNRVKDSPHGWRPKLNPERVAEMRLIYQPRRVTKPMLAARFNVSVACVKKVLDGSNWK